MNPIRSFDQIYYSLNSQVKKVNYKPGRDRLLEKKIDGVRNEIQDVVNKISNSNPIGLTNLVGNAKEINLKIKVLKTFIEKNKYNLDSAGYLKIFAEVKLDDSFKRMEHLLATALKSDFQANRHIVGRREENNFNRLSSQHNYPRQNVAGPQHNYPRQNVAGPQHNYPCQNVAGPQHNYPRQEVASPQYKPYENSPYDLQRGENLSTSPEQDRFDDFKNLARELQYQNMDSYVSKGRYEPKHKLSNEVNKIINFIKEFEMSSFLKEYSEKTVRFSKKEVKGFYKNEYREKAPNVPLIYNPQTKEWFVDKVRHLGAGSFKKASLMARITGGYGKESLFANAMSKIPTGGINASNRKMFNAEVNLGRRLPQNARGINGYRTVIQCKSSKTGEEKVGIISDFLNGGELTDSIRSKKLSAKEKRIVALDLIYGSLAMAKNNLASRDIKPENIMLQKNEFGEVTAAKHIDFGLITEADNYKERNVSCGTPYYMAPELLQGDFYKNRDMKKLDSYSLGVTLIELINGSIPGEISGNSIREIGMRRNRINPQTFLSTLTRRNPFLNGQEKTLLSLATSCLDPDPMRRLSAEDMIRTLENERDAYGDPLFNRSRVSGELLA